MRLIFKTILIISTFSLLITGCSEDSTPEFEPTGTIEEEDGEQVSVFNLDMETNDALTGTHEVTFHITATHLETDYSFPGTVKADKAVSGNISDFALRCRMKLRDFVVPDGDYFISITGESLPNFGAFKIRLFDRTITQLQRSTYAYNGLNGEGTKEKPYLSAVPTTSMPSSSIFTATLTTDMGYISVRPTTSTYGTELTEWSVWLHFRGPTMATGIP